MTADSCTPAPLGLAAARRAPVVSERLVAHRLGTCYHLPARYVCSAPGGVCGAPSGTYCGRAAMSQSGPAYCVCDCAIRARRGRPIPGRDFRCSPRRWSPRATPRAVHPDAPIRRTCPHRPHGRPLDTRAETQCGSSRLCRHHRLTHEGDYRMHHYAPATPSGESAAGRSSRPAPIRAVKRRPQAMFHVKHEDPLARPALAADRRLAGDRRGQPRIDSPALRHRLAEWELCPDRGRRRTADVGSVRGHGVADDSS